MKYLILFLLFIVASCNPAKRVAKAIDNADKIIQTKTFVINNRDSIIRIAPFTVHVTDSFTLNNTKYVYNYDHTHDSVIIYRNDPTLINQLQTYKTGIDIANAKAAGIDKELKDFESISFKILLALSIVYFIFQFLKYRFKF